MLRQAIFILRIGGLKLLRDIPSSKWPLKKLLLKHKKYVYVIDFYRLIFSVWHKTKKGTNPVCRSSYQFDNNSLFFKYVKTYLKASEFKY